MITLKIIEYLSHNLAKETMKWNEPIPSFDTRYPNILESCILIPFQKFNKKDLYPGLINKASILFYLLIKNHHFQSGNKRIAVTTLLVFLYLNEKWIKVDNQELYNFAIWIAQSPPRLKNEVIKVIQAFIQKNIVKI